MAKREEYVPIGRDSETNEWAIPGAPNVTEEFAQTTWTSQKFFYANTGKPGAGIGSVRRVIPKMDGKLERLSYQEAPTGAPVFGYNQADNIKRAIHNGTKPIDALLSFVSTDTMSPNWLRDAGAKSDALKSAELGETRRNTTPEMTAAVLAKHGIAIPDEAASELGLDLNQSVAPLQPVVEHQPEPVRDQAKKKPKRTKPTSVERAEMAKRVQNGDVSKAAAAREFGVNYTTYLAWYKKDTGDVIVTETLNV